MKSGCIRLKCASTNLKRLEKNIIITSGIRMAFSGYMQLRKLGNRSFWRNETSKVNKGDYIYFQIQSNGQKGSVTVVLNIEQLPFNVITYQSLGCVSHTL